MINAIKAELEARGIKALSASKVLGYDMGRDNNILVLKLFDPDDEPLPLHVVSVVYDESDRPKKIVDHAIACWCQNYTGPVQLPWAGKAS